MNLSELIFLIVFTSAAIYAGYVFWKRGSFKGRDPYDKTTWNN